MILLLPPRSLLCRLLSAASYLPQPRSEGPQDCCLASPLAASITCLSWTERKRDYCCCSSACLTPAAAFWTTTRLTDSHAYLFCFHWSYQDSQGWVCEVPEVGGSRGLKGEVEGLLINIHWILNVSLLSRFCASSSKSFSSALMLLSINQVINKTSSRVPLYLSNSLSHFCFSIFISFHLYPLTLYLPPLSQSLSSIYQVKCPL